MAGGIAASSGLGTLGIGARNIPLVGQSISAQQGEFAPRHGQVMFGLQGGMQPRNTLPALIGQQIQGQTGTVVYEPESSGDTFVHISTEEEVTFRQGTVRPVTPLSGVAATSATGTLVPSVAGVLVADVFMQATPGQPVPGIDADEILVISSQGSFAARQLTLELVGQSVSGGTGNFITNDKQAELGGAALEIVAGVVDVEQATALLGEDMFLAQSPVQAPGFAELVGEGMTIATSDLVISQALVGQEATVELGVVAQGADLIGQQLSLVFGDFGGVPKEAALAGQALVASAGDILVLGVWGKAPANAGVWTKPPSHAGVWTKDNKTDGSWTKDDGV